MRKIMLWAGLAVLIVGAIVGWRAAHPSLSDAEQIAANMDDLVQSVNARMQNGVGAHLTPDFHWGQMTKAEVLRNMGAGFTMQYRNVNLRISGVATEVDGDSARSTGHYSLELRSEVTSAPEIYTGDFDLGWRKADGQWKIEKATGKTPPEFTN